MGGKTLVIGGIRSGKTALAEKAAAESGSKVVYVATATAGDEEMARRIDRHRSLRPSHWGLEEEPTALGQVLDRQAESVDPPCLLVDCMSLWISNLLFAGDEMFRIEREAFLAALEQYPGSVVIVSNEVGLGTIGMDSLTRRFCNEIGLLNQELGARCHRVLMSVAGLPLTLKEELPY
ncbi:bifunctional adenosylcobinamide kinase/adenosylcobinamide-phosphate guanylyltransferase [Marinobacter nanhaiticus D15-8W]|uniref:Bifunctional adenosylcobalamin biosynthesis protein n=1 Tax=Marinobacter nanhaiticus D15-8W TaxID=626887 RepID=N6WZI6_9GAMM|nr:bifunctional adenosylcobinamide kinase/adenosylcobinamide-phosphate guanylyltransferase [Marinobacter nanhaiticus]ENO14173.1 bifunctional adenosylcobinamide kinase/adenosylcobinamide-phosphate guanylyltransferase [Marinobacter nanhaiticus D15-8W]BES71558.1 bifunctional adenosylcobinamide kinase/adenosylcobinamide-phosphate guanylyltransferase [Marinobacter nanhaiticus D15-8W]